MFKSIKEVLITISNNENNLTYLRIAKYLLNCLENNLTVKSSIVARDCFISESVLTSFAKQYGYSGFREISLRMKIENEYYQNKQESNYLYRDNFRFLFNKNLDAIDNQEQKVQFLINKLENSSKIYFLSSYEQTSQVELFAGELQEKGYSVFFNTNRKANSAWIKQVKDTDLVVFFVFGLDNQYIVNYYELIQKKTANVFIVSSNSQKIKFKDYLENIVVDYSNRIDISLATRISSLHYLFSKVLFGLKVII